MILFSFWLVTISVHYFQSTVGYDKSLYKVSSSQTPIERMPHMGLKACYNNKLSLLISCEFENTFLWTQHLELLFDWVQEVLHCAT